MFGSVNEDEAFGAQACMIGEYSWPDQKRCASEAISPARNLSKLCALILLALDKRSTLHPIRGVNKVCYMDAGPDRDCCRLH
jgi:hypothetical protein